MDLIPSADAACRMMAGNDGFYTQNTEICSNCWECPTIKYFSSSWHVGEFDHVRGDWQVI